MTGDLGSDAGRARSRPSFLPPVDGYPPPHEGFGEPAPDTSGGQPPRRGAAWSFAMIAAAAALLVSAFLPWAHAQIVVQLFGQPIGRDLGSVAGIDADTMVVAVPALAVVAIALASWDLIGRDARIGALAAIPGTLTLLVCGVFVLRLSDVRDNLPQTSLDLGYQITVRYGWYLAVIMSLLVVGFSLARPISERVGRPHRRPDQYYPQYPYRYEDQQYGADPYAAWPQDDAAWPQEDQAWDRHDPEEQDATPDGKTPDEEPADEKTPDVEEPADEEEPKKDQS